FTFNFTFTTAKMSTLMRNSQTSFISTSIFVGFIASSALLFSNQASAQDFRLGLAVTPNASWMVSTDYDHTAGGSKLNFGYEFIADVLFSENYALGFGVHIFNTGSKLTYLVMNPDDVSEVLDVDRTYSLQYVELPFTFKMRTKEIGYAKIFSKFGLGLGMNVKSLATEGRHLSWEFDGDDWVSVTSNGWVINEGVDVNEEVKLFRAALIVGGGIERNLTGSTSLTVGLNYNAAFNNIHKGVELIKVDNGVPEVINGSPISGVMKGNDRFLELSVGILF
ncbi:MAG: outer membrane beta-barrel protein, partial [Flavobacteriales bacterium]